MNNEEGQDLAEYGLLLGFIAILVMVAIAILGEKLLYYFDVLVVAIQSWMG